jgi:hypothetical protein
MHLCGVIPADNVHHATTFILESILFVRLSSVDDADNDGDMEIVGKMVLCFIPWTICNSVS